MRRVATLAFLALVVFGRFSTPSNHCRTAAADEGGDSGDDSGDDDGDDGYGALVSCLGGSPLQSH